jgi:hypothetical protein
VRLSVRFRTATPRLRAVARVLVLAATVLAGGACDAAQRARKAITAEAGDPVWRGDSTALAAHPEVLFRVTRDSTGRRVVPLATLGPRGFRLLTLSDRGWRALDLAYLQRGQTLRPYRAGASQPAVPSTRGMWEGAPLDTIAGCSVLLPGGLADLPDGVEFVTSAPRPPLKSVTPLSGGELQTAIDAIPLLIAPAAGIPMAMMPRYTRSVHVAATGNGPRPSIIVVYDDPEVVPDTTQPIAQRPRHLVVVLDKGVYGYKPTYTYSTLGNKRTPPRLRYLDHLDTDGDGASELFFGITNTGATLYTIVLRYEVDAWRELLRNERQRCHR